MILPLSCTCAVIVPSKLFPYDDTIGETTTYLLCYVNQIYDKPRSIILNQQINMIYGKGKPFVLIKLEVGNQLYLGVVNHAS